MAKKKILTENGEQIWPIIRTDCVFNKKNENLIINDIGNLASLETDNKNNLVEAINEVIQYGDAAKQKLLNILNNKGYEVSNDNTWDELNLIVYENITPNINIPCEGIELNAQSVDFTAIGEQFQLEAILYPSNTTDELTWEIVSGTDTITVDNNGLVTCIGESQGAVKAKCGNYSASCSFSVYLDNIDANSATTGNLMLKGILNTTTAYGGIDIDSASCINYIAGSGITLNISSITPYVWFILNNPVKFDGFNTITYINFIISNASLGTNGKAKITVFITKNLRGYGCESSKPSEILISKTMTINSSSSRLTYPVDISNFYSYQGRIGVMIEYYNASGYIDITDIYIS